MLTATTTKACKQCGSQFSPWSSTQTVCGRVCARRLVNAQKKQEAERKKLDRMMYQQRRQALRTIPELEEDCRKIVQKIARLRDRDDGCISCHMGPNYGGQWHGSHYRPAGNNSAVQFHLWNIHKACAQCNLFKGGNIGEYRPRLIEKIGLDRVEWLESQSQPVKSDRAYLCRFKKVMGKRLRRMERSIK